MTGSAARTRQTNAPRGKLPSDEPSLSFLDKLRRGELLRPDSIRELVLLMEGERTPRRLLAGLPEGVRFAL
ncbi:MAG: hypothetical protein JWR00_4597 [Rubritepida sp.]|nr:hypothetical protein [Rubritepida sp.]